MAAVMTAIGGLRPDIGSLSTKTESSSESIWDTKNDISRVARINNVKNENTVTIPNRANPTP